MPKKSRTAKKNPTPQKKRKPSGIRTKINVRNRLNSRQAGGRLLLWSLETAALLVTGLTLLLLLFGFAARRFTGTDPYNNLLPFLVSIAAICFGSAVLLIFWWKIRPHLSNRTNWLPASVAIVITLVTLLTVPANSFQTAYITLRTMIGGKKEADRLNLAHQIYAAYRRQEVTHLQKMAERSEKYRDDIFAAAAAFDLDPDLLFGIAAAESSFLPRKSEDGGIGLFQLTNVPDKVEKKVRELLDTPNLSRENRRHNAYVAAATVQYYIDQMHGDLFLGLLAYNIGPKNGGLRFIMDQYHVRDFISIQPYLQQSPRNYPIRVLSHALAFRLYHQEEGFLPYEEGANALRIQRIGIPEMDRL